MSMTAGLKSVLSQLYPPQLLLLVLFPNIVGFIIDYDLSDGWAVVANLIWMLIFTFPFFIWQKEWIYKAGVCFYFVIGFIEIGHWLMMKGPLSIISLLIISNTNSEEALAFLDTKLDWTLIVLLLFTVLFVFALRKVPNKPRSMVKPVYAGIVILISLSIILGVKRKNNIRKHHFIPRFAKITYAFVNELEDYYNASRDNVIKEVSAKLDIKSNNKQTFVLILGESCSRNHMSIYKPELNTNPKLASRNDLIVYTDVISGYSYTIQSVLAMLSDSNLEDEKKVSERIDLIDIFHSAGFKTYWISNQSPIGIFDNAISGLARKSDHVEFVNTVSNSSEEAVESRVYDENLISPFKRVLQDSVDKKFIVLHLMGSHLSYSKRYPPGFEYYRNEGSERDQIIAHYRNSVRYNDYIVDSLLNTLEEFTTLEKNEVTSAIYVSDHGENVFDEVGEWGQGLGHDYVKELSRAVVEIPFLVWLSKGFINERRNRISIIQDRIDIPYMTDDLFHSIIDLNGIRTPLLDPSRSLFHSDYDLARKRIIVDGKDYDR